MVIDNNNTKYFTRQEVKKHFSEEFINSILKKHGRDFRSSLENAIDEGYCYGYNIVLSAIESVFGGLTENYWKIVNKLQEWDSKRKKEIENENNN